MSRFSRGLLVVAAYALVILSTASVSGKITERKTLYDLYLVGLEGVIIPTSDRERAVGFYTDILDFRPVHRDAGPQQRIPGFELPDGQRLYLSENGNPPVTVVIKVKNGFRRLRNGLLARGAGDKVSQVQKQRWGEEFIVRDIDGNQLVFYSPNRFKRGRM